MNTWIFQGNPDSFAIDTYLDRRLITWTVRQVRYENVMNCGDRVFIWRAAGNTKIEPGIIASGWLIERPHNQLDDAPELWYKQEEPIEDIRVQLCIDKRVSFGRMVRARQLKEDAILRGLRILRCPRETIYLLAKEEAERLATIWKDVEPIEG
jgi:hypothetical protein